MQGLRNDATITSRVRLHTYFQSIQLSIAQPFKDQGDATILFATPKRPPCPFADCYKICPVILGMSGARSVCGFARQASAFRLPILDTGHGVDQVSYAVVAPLPVALVLVPG
jgi:hypothetical protein